MAVEMHVLFGGKLPDKKALSRAMAELGFPLTIAAGSLERENGFMPMRLRREETGVAFDVFDDRAAVEELGGKDIDPAFERSANFRWAGDQDEMLAGLCAAAALAKLVNGVVLEEQEGKLLSPDEAIALARETLQATWRPQDRQRRSTRPADIKRYLKPLLRQRSDLVLIGRTLLIRPVRHILRGALLDRTSDKYSFRIWPYLMPLWGGPPESVGCMDCIHDGLWQVWQPHFEPLLMDALAHDIFGPLGKITTHDDLAAAVSCTDDLRDFHVNALVLAGEPERAAEYIRDIEARRAPTNDYYTRWAETKRRFLAKDIGEFCVKAHTWEAEAVKALKLESIWEPAPFPVELPADERKSQTAEPPFVAQPWLPRPPGLLQEVPGQRDDIRFAKDWLFRGWDNPVLVAPLSREQAEERHRNGEDYVLAAWLPDGLLLLLHIDGTDRHEPRRAEHSNQDPAVYAGGFSLELHSSQFVATASSHAHRDANGMAEVSSVEVYKLRTSRLIWQWSFSGREPEEIIRDSRGGERVERRVLTETDIDRFRCPKPSFGEFAAIVGIVLSILRRAGYGEIA